jgi:hypothetical protein
MNKDLDRMHIEIDLFRQKSDPKNILVCFSEDYHSEQRHLLQASSSAVSAQSVIECLQKIVSRLVEGSVFGNAGPPGTLETVPVQTGPQR